MSKKILLVDDEEDIRLTVGRRLKVKGYEVRTAENGLEAAAQAKEWLPDLVILDVMMPEMNGYQACRVMREDEKTKGIPVLMLTAKSQESDQFWGYEVGANRYLTKPFDDEALMEAVEELLGEK